MLWRIIFFIVPIVFVQSYPSNIVELEDSYSVHNTENEITKGRIHMTLKQYHCAWNDSYNSKLLTFGAKSWVFPKQDVNLVLSYPDKNVDSKLLTFGAKSWVFPKQDVNLVLSYPDKNETIKSNDVITKFNVLIMIDSTHSRGYITSGGILQDHISLSFVFSGITSLTYQFWLYGLPNEYLPRIDPYTNVHNMC
ncbi:hypothetical protein RR46_00688 [Papilio xuthus]|uniref:Uncharacterized protein n=1 Tax=Papilio xuthus TaxID=66420 RepID=A0A0N1I3P8_PAPXU|nr:hypothetical protein RR46_00688 [Papilio xuthus]